MRMSQDCSPEATWSSLCFRVIVWTRPCHSSMSQCQHTDIRTSALQARGGITECKCLKTTPWKCQLTGIFLPKIKGVKLAISFRRWLSEQQLGCTHLAQALRLKEAAGPFSIAQNSLTWSLLCALDSQSFYHCCHFPGHSFITYIKANGWCTDFSFIYVDNSCIFHVLCSDKTVIQQSLKLAHFPSVLWKERDV